MPFRPKWVFGKRPTRRPVENDHNNNDVINNSNNDNNEGANRAGDDHLLDHEGFHMFPLKRRLPSHDSDYYTAPLERIDHAIPADTSTDADSAHNAITTTTNVQNRVANLNNRLAQRKLKSGMPDDPLSATTPSDTRTILNGASLASVVAAAELFPQCVADACEAFGLEVEQHTTIEPTATNPSPAARCEIITTESAQERNIGPLPVFAVRAVTLDPDVVFSNAAFRQVELKVARHDANLVDNVINYHRIGRAMQDPMFNEIAGRNLFHEVFPKTVQELAKFTMICDDRRWQYTAKASHISKASDIEWEQAENAILAPLYGVTVMVQGRISNPSTVLRFMRGNLTPAVEKLADPMASAAERQQALRVVTQYLPRGHVINQEEWVEGSVDTVMIDNPDHISNFATNRVEDGASLKFMDEIDRQDARFKPIYDGLVDKSLKAARVAMDLQHAYADMTMDMLELCRNLDNSGAAGADIGDEAGATGISIVSGLSPEIKARFDTELAAAQQMLEQTKQKLEQLGAIDQKAKLDDIATESEILQWGAPLGLFNGSSFIFHQSIIALAHAAPEEFLLPPADYAEAYNNRFKYRVPRTADANNLSQDKLNILYTYGKRGGLGTRDLMTGPRRPWVSWGNAQPMWTPEMIAWANA